MAFSIFGKKSQPETPGADAGTPDPSRRVAGIADYFAGGAEAAGRFAARIQKRRTESPTTLGPGSRSRAGYRYGPEWASSQIESIAERSPDAVASIESVPPNILVPELLAGSSGRNIGPVTEAAFTQVPSQLDLEAVPGRRAALTAIDMPAEIEACALAFANGDVPEALKQIDTAIAADDLGTWSQQGWLMRFDLYEQLGLKAAFETEALAFAQKFERSPPVWEVHRRRAAEPLVESIPTVNITGRLSAASAAPLSALRKTVTRYPGVRLDMSRLQAADRDGCRYLLVTIQSLKRANKQVRLGAPAVIVDILRPSIRPGDRSSDATTWLLYLEVLQLTDAPDEFERVAIDYATTFEVSPPSWQSPPPVTALPETDALADDRIYFDGEVTAPASELFAQLQRFAATRSTVILDLAGLSRLDVGAASQLANDLAQLQLSGHRIEIRSPNEMVSALLVLMGVNESARIVARRA